MMPTIIFDETQDISLLWSVDSMGKVLLIVPFWTCATGRGMLMHPSCTDNQATNA